jgi:hypothetical protein
MRKKKSLCNLSPHFSSTELKEDNDDEAGFCRHDITFYCKDTRLGNLVEYSKTATPGSFHRPSAASFSLARDIDLESLKTKRNPVMSAPKPWPMG